MELDLFDKGAVSVDMLLHRGICLFLELKKLTFKDSKFCLTLCAVLRHKLIPRNCRRFTSDDMGVRVTIVLDGIKKVVVRKVVHLIPFVDGNFVGGFWIPTKVPVKAPIGMGFDIGTEIDGARFDARFDIATGRVGALTGDDVPKLILDEETLGSLHPIVEVFFIELSESERRKLRKWNVEGGCRLHFSELMILDFC